MLNIRNWKAYSHTNVCQHTSNKIKSWHPEIRQHFDKVLNVPHYHIDLEISIKMMYQNKEGKTSEIRQQNET